mmetsp:Transcript_20666/g.58610  ORF Transcript_20666/g.58610 Transcript_20666/m.58610 type:complete len:336 (-) Transcript_20666:177-1184(-)
MQPLLPAVHRAPRAGVPGPHPRQRAVEPERPPAAGREHTAVGGHRAMPQHRGGVKAVLAALRGEHPLAGARVPHNHLVSAKGGEAVGEEGELRPRRVLGAPQADAVRLLAPHVDAAVASRHSDRAPAHGDGDARDGALGGGQRALQRSVVSAPHRGAPGARGDHPRAAWRRLQQLDVPLALRQHAQRRLLVDVPEHGRADVRAGWPCDEPGTGEQQPGDPPPGSAWRVELPQLLAGLGAPDHHAPVEAHGDHAVAAGEHLRVDDVGGLAMVERPQHLARSGVPNGALAVRVEADDPVALGKHPQQDDAPRHPPRRARGRQHLAAQAQAAARPAAA